MTSPVCYVGRALSTSRCLRVPQVIRQPQRLCLRRHGSAVAVQPLVNIPAVKANPKGVSGSVVPADSSMVPLTHRVRVFGIDLNISRKLDLQSLVDAVLLADEAEQSLRVSRWYAVLERDVIHFSLRPLTDEQELDSASNKLPPSHATVSRRGIVVFTNCDIADAVYLIGLLRTLSESDNARMVSKHSHMRRDVEVLSAIERKWLSSHPSSADILGVRDSTTLVIDPTFAAWSGRPTSSSAIRLRKLDLDSIRVISDVIAQSLILQRYEQRLEALHGAVERVNLSLQRVRLHDLKPQEMSQLLVLCNTILGDLLISHVGESSRPGSPAWLHPQRYGALEEHLMTEFEVSQRHDHMLRMLNYVNDLLKVCLGSSKDNQLHKLEYMIIVILVLEVLLKLWEVYGHPAAAKGEVTAAPRPPYRCRPNEPGEGTLSSA